MKADKSIQIFHIFKFYLYHIHICHITFFCGVFNKCKFFPVAMALFWTWVLDFPGKQWSAVATPNGSGWSKMNLGFPGKSRRFQSDQTQHAVTDSHLSCLCPCLWRLGEVLSETVSAYKVLYIYYIYILCSTEIAAFLLSS